MRRSPSDRRRTTEFLERLAEPAPGSGRVHDRRVFTPGHGRRVPGDPRRAIPTRRWWPAAPISAWNRISVIRGGRTWSAWKRSTSCANSRAPAARDDRRGAAAQRIGREWTDAPDVFREWLTLFASPLIRNRATLGGNLATASPIGDAAPLLLALDAIVHVAGRSGRRCDSAGVVLHRLSEDRPAARRDSGERRDSEAAAASLSGSTRSPSAGSTTSARWRRRWRWISTRRAACGARGLRLAASRRRRCASPRPKTPSSNQPWNEAAVERVQDVLDRDAEAAERPPRLEGVPPRGVQEPGREILVGAAA